MRELLPRGPPHDGGDRHCPLHGRRRAVCCKGVAGEGGRPGALQGHALDVKAVGAGGGAPRRVRDRVDRDARGAHPEPLPVEGLPPVRRRALQHSRNLVEPRRHPPEGELRLERQGGVLDQLHLHPRVHGGGGARGDAGPEDPQGACLRDGAQGADDDGVPHQQLPAHVVGAWPYAPLHVDPHAERTVGAPAPHPLQEGLCAQQRVAARAAPQPDPLGDYLEAPVELNGPRRHDPPAGEGVVPPRPAVGRGPAGGALVVGHLKGGGLDDPLVHWPRRRPEGKRGCPRVGGRAAKHGDAAVCKRLPPGRGGGARPPPDGEEGHVQLRLGGGGADGAEGGVGHLEEDELEGGAVQPPHVGLPEARQLAKDVPAHGRGPYVCARAQLAPRVAEREGVCARRLQHEPGHVVVAYRGRVEHDAMLREELGRVGPVRVRKQPSQELVQGPGRDSRPSISPVERQALQVASNLPAGPSLQEGEGAPRGHDSGDCVALRVGRPPHLNRVEETGHGRWALRGVVCAVVCDYDRHLPRCVRRASPVEPRPLARRVAGCDSERAIVAVRGDTSGGAGHCDRHAGHCLLLQAPVPRVLLPRCRAPHPARVPGSEARVRGVEALPPRADRHGIHRAVREHRHIGNQARTRKLAVRGPQRCLPHLTVDR
mmetsp:Transcript_26748/g.64641  ORF Transcript_26748/g.64641 Transcript_26748/m.64641 type:complete len:655 (+) Transcript_26748:1012-2976(+)